MHICKKHVFLLILFIEREVANDFGKLNNTQFDVDSEAQRKTTLHQEETYNHQVYLHMKKRLDHEMDMLTRKGDYLQNEVEKHELLYHSYLHKVNVSKKTQAQTESCRNKLFEQLETVFKYIYLGKKNSCW